MAPSSDAVRLALRETCRHRNLCPRRSHHRAQRSAARKGGRGGTGDNGDRIALPMGHVIHASPSVAALRLACHTLARARTGLREDAGQHSRAWGVFLRHVSHHEWADAGLGRRRGRTPGGRPAGSDGARALTCFTPSCHCLRQLSL